MNHPSKAADNIITPMIAVKTLWTIFTAEPTIKSPGLKTNIKGIMYATVAKRKDVKAVEMALLPEIDAAAYAVKATGGVTCENTAK